MYDKIVKHNQTQLKSKYNKYKRKLERLIFLAKQKYLADKVDIVKNNSKSLWKLLNQITNRKRKKKTVISHLMINNNETI